MRSPVTVLLAFLRLGLLSFGGPVAHLAYFRDEFVRRRAWVDDETFAECVALTQLLPGPGSSQTGMLLGWLAAGPLGALAAWVGFTLPSALLMGALALLLPTVATARAGWLHGLLLVAAAVVASAVVTMRATLAPDGRRLGILAAAFVLVLAIPNPAIVPAAIGLCAVAGSVLLYGRIPTADARLDLGLSRRVGLAALALFALMLAGLSAVAYVTRGHAVTLFEVLFRVGSLVFGGGHVVLPLLQAQVASAGIADAQTILTGYAAAQAMPGPLFTIASYMGASAYGRELGAWGAVLGTVAIFSPSFFLLAGVAPFYGRLARGERFRAALAGANAGVVGLLAAAFVTPIWTGAVRNVPDVCFAAIAFAAVHRAKAPAWSVVAAGALAGAIIFH